MRFGCWPLHAGVFCGTALIRRYAGRVSRYSAKRPERADLFRDRLPVPMPRPADRTAPRSSGGFSSLLNLVEQAQEKVRGQYDFGCEGRVVVVDWSVRRRVREEADRARAPS